MDIDDAHAIAALKDVEPWQRLCALIEQQHADYTAAVGRTMMTTGKPPQSGDDRSFDFKRGYWAGQLALIRNPDAAIAAIKKDAARRKEAVE